jgi:hypothetical protein
MTHGGERNEEDIPKFEGQVVFQGDYEPLSQFNSNTEQQETKQKPTEGPFTV